ncbi:MAG: SDR family oxidoreductase [Puniceicoccales bacterium]|jgi:NAD(P)-dependent dehydrogenase (short-subunit alcohol dehydrogenase family)|nr:SDR family oxidoreductase [Puniceicoccales bacterium]
MNSVKKVAIITGGARGVGKGIALRFLRDEYQIVLADIDAVALAETTDELDNHDAVLAVQTDVGNEDSVRNLIARTLERFGRIDVLVNNAGIAAPVSGAIEDLSLDAWNRVIGVNLSGVFLCCKYAVPELRKTRGAIVNMASTRALQSEPNTETYAASKGGVVALTHALAVSLGPDIRVNCISPGWIVVDEWQKRETRHAAQLRPEDHQQHPCGRAGVPDDIASMASFLAGAEAGFITGQDFVVDGGMTRRMIYVE